MTRTRLAAIVLSVFAACTMDASIAKADLVSQWPFDGDLLDRGPAGRDGVFVGGRFPIFDRGQDLSRVGAIALDGVDDHVQIPGRTSIYRARRYSVAFWVKAGRQTARTVFAESDGAQAVFVIGTDARRTSSLRVAVHTARGVAILEGLSSGPVFDDAWHHVAWTDDGGNARLWIDGEPDAADWRYTWEDINLVATRVGAGLTGARAPTPCCFLGGSIDELRLYNHVLSESEVRELAGIACAPATLREVLPALVASTGGTRVVFTGAGIAVNHVAFVGGLELERQVFREATGELSGIVPPLAPGFYDAELFCDGELVARLESAVEAAPPPTLESVSPDRIELAGGTPVEVRGANLRPETEIRFGSELLVDPEVAADGTSVIGKAPAAAQSGSVDVSARDARGTAVLPGAVTYYFDDPCSPDRVRLESVSPQLVSTAGDTPLEVRGVNLDPTHLVTIGGAPLLKLELVSPMLIRGVTPVLQPGLHTVELRCATGPVIAGPPVVARLVDAIEAAPPIELVGVDPPEIFVDGGSEFRVIGRNFHRSTVVRIDGRPLEDASIVPGVAALMSIRGIAPAGASPGAVDVTVEDGRGVAILSDAVTYVIEELPPGPEQGEASNAEGTARFTWYNPIEYETIQVLGDGGRVLAELAGDATFYEMPTGGADRVAVTVVGRSGDGGPSRGSYFQAVRQDCDTPPPLDAILQEIAGRFEGLEYEDVEFSLYGAHSEPAVTRCSDGGGGGVRGHGGAVGLPPRAGALEPGRGFIRRPSLTQVSESEVTTGFTLERPARKLEFAAHYRLLTATAGVRVRAHLIHVFPDDGFEDVFTFPLTEVSTENDWHLVTYFRADSDVGRDIEGGEDPGPQPCTGGADCGGVEIPAGDYVLKLFAIGGDSEVPYFAVTADPSPEELLIAGTPCPPYPILRVRDVSDEETLPVVSGIDCTKISFAICPLDAAQRVRLTALGYWLDTCNEQHSLDPYDPRFEFSWRIYDGATSQVLLSGHRPWIELCLDCGCYRVEITVRRTGCPVTRTYLREAVVTPPTVPCSPGRRFEFLYPQPDPTGMIGIVGLDPAGQPLGMGYADERPLEFTVLVSPNTACGAAGDGQVTESDIEFDLGNTGILGRALGAQFQIFDDCPFTPDGRKYFRIRLDDLGAVAAHGTLDAFTAQSVYLLGRAKDRGEPWQRFGGPLKLRNPPDVLATSAWHGSFTPSPDRYLFHVQSSEENEQDFSMGPSADINLDLSLLGDGAEAIDVAGHPDNGVQGGFTSQFSLDAGGWSDEEGVGGMRGGMMGSEISGAPLQLGADGGAGNGRGGDVFPEWEWCSGGNIFNYEFQEDIYKGIIYQGTIWVIPVSVWATIGFGFFINIDYQLTFKLHPFSIVQGFEAACAENNRPAGTPSFADAWMYLLVDAGISIPAAVRADILFGVASIALRLEPQAKFGMTPWLEAHAELPDPTFAPHMHLGANFRLLASAEACIFWELFCVRVPDPPAPIFDVPIFSCPDIFDCVCPACIETCDDPGQRECVGDGRGGDLADGAGGGVSLVNIHALVSIPETIVSPDGATTVDVWMSADDVETGTLNLRQRGAQNRDFIFTLDAPNPFFLDPAGAYISGDVALIAFTETNGASMEAVPPLDVNDPHPYLGPSNRNAARANIRVHVLGPDTTNLVAFMNSGVELSESSADIADWRADGMTTMAGSPTHGDAWIAWVRYEEDFLADHGTRSIRTSNQPHNVETVRDLQPRIDTTSIYVRQITYSTPDGVTPVGGMAPLKISEPGINIEPDLGATREGDVFACVWVHDGLHENLTDDNRGRELLFSLWSRGGAGGWSAPARVVRSDILNRYPGILEPRVALKRSDAGRLEGLIGFVAVPQGAEPDDTGMGGLMYLYTVRLREDAGGAITFDEPVRIRGRCDARVYAWNYEIGFDPGRLAPSPLDEILIAHGPDAVIIYQSQGVPGTQASAGDVMVTALGQGMNEWTPPMRLTGGERTITNTVASAGPNGLHVLYLDQGAARPGTEIAGGGVGGGIAGPMGYQTVDCPLRADLVLASCRLSHQFAGPGARVRARVRVENNGLASSPMTEAGDSFAGVEIIFRDEAGKERLVASSPLPVLEPGMVHELELTIEMPHDPVRLEARISPNPFDHDPSNDSRECDFGAPCPVNLRCSTVVVGGDEPALAAIVEWDNPVGYDEVFLYRDGLLVTSLPGTSERYSDEGVALGTHLYEVRGCAGASRSVRAACSLDVSPPVPPVTFLRADSNDDGEVDVSDAVSALHFLVLGSPTPRCPDAVDANDDGVLDIADAVFALEFVFLGATSPPAPGAESCGVDPTEDGLDACTAERCAEEGGR